MTAGRRSPRRRPVSLSVDQAIGTITLESPANGNRIDSKLASAFRRVCEEVSADDAVRAVLVVSDGDRRPAVVPRGRVDAVGTVIGVAIAGPWRLLARVLESHPVRAEERDRSRQLRELHLPAEPGPCALL